MNDDEYQHEWNREVAELLERIARSVERLSLPIMPAPPPVKLTRCCPICIATWEGTMDEPCPRCGGKWKQKLSEGSASCTGTDCDCQSKP